MPFMTKAEAFGVYFLVYTRSAFAADLIAPPVGPEVGKDEADVFAERIYKKMVHRGIDAAKINKQNLKSFLKVAHPGGGATAGAPIGSLALDDASLIAALPELGYGGGGICPSDNQEAVLFNAIASLNLPAHQATAPIASNGK